MSKKKIGAITGGAVLAVALGLSGLAFGNAAGERGPKTIHVQAGESIQAALDRARPGDAVEVAAGVYRENLTITTDHVTLRGAGASADGTVLQPPAEPAGRVCDFEGTNGICVTGEFTPNSDEIGTPVRGVTVTGLSVRGFPRFGILVNNAVGATVSGNETSGNGAYGVFGVFVTGIRLLGNSSHDNQQGGLYVSDSPHADALVAGNRSYRNHVVEGFGLFVRDASNGVVRDNRFEDNCVGLAIAGTSGPTAGWTVRRNVVSGNTSACPPSDDVPTPLSGLGIVLIGASHVHVSENTVEGNRPSGDTPVSGGIALVSAKPFGGQDPDSDAVVRNHAHGNDPADLVYDGSGRNNQFTGNDCGASLPDGLCG
jgi:nitrous oxidase accessory protein NosD